MGLFLSSVNRFTLVTIRVGVWPPGRRPNERSQRQLQTASINIKGPASHLLCGIISNFNAGEKLSGNAEEEHNTEPDETSLME